MKYLTDQEQKDLTTSNVVCFVIEGNPITLKRPRFASGIVYDSQKKEKVAIEWILHEQIMKYAIRKQFNFPLDGNISLSIKFYFSIPRSASQKKKDLLRGAPRGGRPDLSNCIKFYEDVMQDVHVYNDDAQIVEIQSQKLYDDGVGPRVEIIIRSLE